MNELIKQSPELSSGWLEDDGEGEGDGFHGLYILLMIKSKNFVGNVTCDRMSLIFPQSVSHAVIEKFTIHSATNEKYLLY